MYSSRIVQCSLYNLSTLYNKLLHFKKCIKITIVPNCILFKILSRYNIFDCTNLILLVLDFGLSKEMSEDTKNYHFCGSFIYMAPEMLVNNEFGIKADLWSIGVILYECLFGRTPYSVTNQESIRNLVEKMKQQKPIRIPSTGYQISPKCINLLCSLLQHDPLKRLNHQQFYSHPFVNLDGSSCQESYMETYLEFESKFIESILLLGIKYQNCFFPKNKDKAIKGYDESTDNESSIDDQFTDDVSTNDQVANNQVTDNQVADNQVADNQVADNQVADDQATNDPAIDTSSTASVVTVKKVKRLKKWFNAFIGIFKRKNTGLNCEV